MRSSATQTTTRPRSDSGSRMTASTIEQKTSCSSIRTRWQPCTSSPSMASTFQGQELLCTIVPCAICIQSLVRFIIQGQRLRRFGQLLQSVHRSPDRRAALFVIIPLRRAAACIDLAPTLHLTHIPAGYRLWNSLRRAALSQPASSNLHAPLAVRRTQGATAQRQHEGIIDDLPAFRCTLSLRRQSARLLGVRS